MKPFAQRLSMPLLLAGALVAAALFARSSVELEAPRPPRVYVTCEKARALAVIDSGADEVVATVPLDGRARGVRVAPDGRVLVAVSRWPHGRNREAVLVVDPA